MVGAVVADDARHEHVADPLADERRHADEHVLGIGVAHESDAAQPRERVLAARAALGGHRVEAAAQRSEGGRVPVEAADLAARRDHVASHALACVEHEPLHRVEIDVEPREIARDPLVEPARARHDTRGLKDVDARGLELLEIPLDLSERARRRTRTPRPRRPSTGPRGRVDRVTRSASARSIDSAWMSASGVAGSPVPVAGPSAARSPAPTPRRARCPCSRRASSSRPGACAALPSAATRLWPPPPRTSLP